MSIALMTQAWKSGLPAGQKMVLLALCDNANDQGECYPSVTMLAAKCSMGERSVQRHITDLEELGILRREMRTGRSTVYHIDQNKMNVATPAMVAPITINETKEEPKANRQARAKPAALIETLPDWLPSETWQAWVEYRKSIKAPLTPHAAKLLVAKLETLRTKGSDPVEVVNNSIMSGKWTGFYAIKQDAAPAAPQKQEYL